MDRENPSPVIQAIQRLVDNLPLGGELTKAAFGQLMQGETTPAQGAALLMGLRLRGETATDLAGAVYALHEAMVPVNPANREHLIDTCGTGGGSVPTFNISTAAAFVAAGAGARVAKHGNRSYTSQCGSADVLEALGVDIALDAERAKTLIDVVGMTFLFAPAFHPAMRHVAPIRKELGVPTIMNMIGPLANPARVDRQLIGVADPKRGALLADAACMLGSRHTLVVYGSIGMDEIAPCGTSMMWEVVDGSVRSWEFDPVGLGIEAVDCGQLAGGEPADNARRVERLFEDPSHDPAGRAAVVVNAGAAIYVAGLADSIEDGVSRAQSSLATGRAADVLARFREVSGVSTSA